MGSTGFNLVRMTGLEPARSYHKILSLARLPIPPHPHMKSRGSANAFTGLFALHPQNFSLMIPLLKAVVK